MLPAVRSQTAWRTSPPTAPGRYLLGASYPGHKLTVNPISSPRTVQPPKQVRPGYPNAHSILADAAASNPNLSLATQCGHLVFVSGQTGRHPVTGDLGKDVREQTRNVLERIKTILTAAGTSLDNVLTAIDQPLDASLSGLFRESYG